MLTLEEAIKHCEEVAEEQEDFDKFQCGYCKPGCEDGVWKHTCRLPSNIPVGSSWGECSEQNCPLFHECLECANEHRQLAEWLKELKALKQNMERQIKGAEEEIEDEYKKTPLDIEKIRTIQIYKECLKDVLYNEMDGVAEPYKADRR